MFSQTQIDRTYIDDLVAGSFPEHQELDYKQKLYEKNDSGRDELLKDVCALANASGGVILYGIAEDGPDKAPKVTPITDELFDVAQQRMQSQIDRLIEPRLPGVSFTRIEYDGGYVMALQIPGSFGGPYWYGTDGKKKFKVRRGTQTSDFSYQELRAAFDRNASATIRARNWVRERITDVRKGRNSLRPLQPGPFVIMHFVPMISYLSESSPIDIATSQKQLLTVPIPWTNAYTYRINFDGLIIYPNMTPVHEDDDDVHGYVQIFRDGTIESVLRVAPLQSDAEVIPPGILAPAVYKMVTTTPQLLGKVGKSGPLLISVSLLSINGYKLLDNRPYGGSPMSADRDNLVVPPFYVADSESEQDNHDVARQVLDMIWQGFGDVACPYFKPDGSRKQS